MDDFSKQFKKDVDGIDVPEERLTKAMQTAMARGKTKRSKKKTVLYASSVAVLGLSILFGSAFFSPALADTFAKVPVIGSIFEKEDPIPIPIKTISKELEVQGYNISSVGVRYQPDKELRIVIDGTEEYLQEVHDEIKTLAEDTLISEGYDAYTVKVDRRIVDHEELAYQEQYMKDLDKVYKALSTINISREQIEIRYIGELKSMEVLVVGTEDFYESVKDEVGEVVNNATKNTVFKYDTFEVNHTDEPLVQVISHDDLPENERMWMKSRIISFIGNELYGKTGYHAENVGHKFVDGVLHLNIYLSLDSSDSKVEEVAEGIRKNIQIIFESDRFRADIEGLPYNIGIYSKDEKLIQ